jgi:hypothetical protein
MLTCGPGTQLFGDLVQAKRSVETARRVHQTL